MVDFINKYPKANALRAANKEGPMHFDRGLNLAGKMCHQKGFEREPPASRSLSRNPQASSQTISCGGGSLGGNSYRGRGAGARGGAGSTSRPSSSAANSVTLSGGQKVCHFWQNNNCNNQNQAFCVRNSVKYLHVCAFIKQGGQVCGKKDHRKPEHDINKH